jgi:hypothetical protein
MMQVVSVRAVLVLRIVQELQPPTVWLVTAIPPLHGIPPKKHANAQLILSSTVLVNASHVGHSRLNMEQDLVQLIVMVILFASAIQLSHLILQLSPVFAKNPNHSSTHPISASLVLIR